MSSDATPVDAARHVTDPAAAGLDAEAAEGPSKVPDMTVFFWIVKIITTALGEAVSDFLVHAITPAGAVALGFVGVVAAVVVQLRSRRYVAAIYWSAALMVSVFGTMAADAAHVVVGIPYLVSAVGCAAALVAVFVVWQRREGTLSIHSITTRRRELFYWATALVTFALGTALGDLTAYTFHLGFLASAGIFAVVFAIPAIAFGWHKLGGIAAFWWAYVVTRPLGASFADWFAKGHDKHGLGYGDGSVSIVLGVALVVFVGYLTVSHLDDPARAAAG